MPSGCCTICGLGFIHVGIAVAAGRQEVFLNGPLGYPPEQVEHAAGLVVGARSPGAAEGLLAHHGPCGLVVDVEVARSLIEGSGHLHNHPAVPGEDGPGEPVGRSGVAEL